MNHRYMVWKAFVLSIPALAGKLFFFGTVVMTTSLAYVPEAHAARCSVDSASASCSYQARNNWYWCGAVYYPRYVRWQVPEGTPPLGGWDTAFYYNGTTPVGTNPFSASSGSSFGMYYLPQIFREMLDNPGGGGKKYAVLAAEPPSSTALLQFWHTNAVFPYGASCDYSFFNDFFGEIKAGSYGPATQYNMNRRFAFGISSGGYNSSRMAVTFNGSSVWKALGIVSASYATCAGPACAVPYLPSNHPPTKFWHGTSDLTVPIFTMRNYYNQLVAQGKATEKVEHSAGHQFTGHALGASGIKSYFDRY
jgi:hypothetical protein